MEFSYREKLLQSNRTLSEERERLRRRETDLEAGLFARRQALLEEMEVVKMREAELQHQMETNKRCERQWCTVGRVIHFATMLD